MAGITGNGIALTFGGTTVGRLTDVTGPDGEVPVIDTTTMDDTVGTSVAGIPQPGTISFSGNYAPSTFGALNTAKMGRTTGAVTLVFSDSSDFSNATGYITKLTPTGSLNGTVRCEGTIQLSGAITHSTS